MERQPAKLKIAVCFFGHLRTYKRCAPFLRENLLRKYDCDLFMHTWTTLDHNTETWYDHTAMKGETDRADVVRAYGEFKGLEIEEQKPLDWGVVKIKPNHNSKERQVSIFGIDAMFRSIRASNRLRGEYAAQNHVKYDLALCVRPDVWLKKPLNLESLLEALSEGDIARGFFTVAHDFSQLVRGFENLGGNDVLFFAAPEVMDDVIKNTEGCAGWFGRDATLPYAPEHELIKLVQKRGWTPYRVNLRIGSDWDICRHVNTNPRRHFVQIRTRKNYIHIYLLQMCMRQLLRLRFAVLNFEFDICVGAAGSDS
jgi:hypothetical protein